MLKAKKLVLFGTGDLAQIAKLYFERDTEYEVVGFTVDDAYLNEQVLMGLPVVPFSKVTEIFSPSNHDIHVCLVYNDMNRLRSSKCIEAVNRGYNLASYISPYAFISPTAKIDKHVFIFENNVIQDFVEVGRYAILWSGNHIGHSSKIGDAVFISSHVVVSGHCNVGDNIFIGVNSTLANNVSIGKESWVMHGAIISSDILANSFVKTEQSAWYPLNERSLTRALERKKK